MFGRKLSVYISLAMCAVFALTELAGVLLIKYVVREVTGGTLAGDGLREGYIILSYWLCVPFALAAALFTALMLISLIKGRVFTRRNVLYIRLVSWCCFAAAALMIPAVVAAPVLALVCGAALFIGTVMLAVKSAFEYAVALREENDLTV